MKKVLSAFLVTVIFVVMIPVAVSANKEYYSEGEYIYTVTDGLATIVSGSVNGKVIIPETLGGFSVTYINTKAFYDDDDIEEVIIPDCVVSIGHAAFQYCDGLKSVIIGTNGYGNITIGKEAFSDCVNLENIVISDSVTSIGGYAFYDCSIRSVIIGKNVTKIEYCSFSACSSLTSMLIPDNVTSIDNMAFDYSEVLVIHCEEGSAAHSYAMRNNIPFIIEDFSEETTFPAESEVVKESNAETQITQEEKSDESDSNKNGDNTVLIVVICLLILVVFAETTYIITKQKKNKK